MNQPDVRPVSSTFYRLFESYTHEWREKGALFRIVVPQGFEFDGASVPRALWSLTSLRPDGLVRAAALVHDYLYRNGGTGVEVFTDRWRPASLALSRAQSDAIFRRLMKKAGMPGHLVWLAWSGVRLGGFLSWKGK